MKFHFDTEKCEDIQLYFDREADLEENILDFCFGISALYTDFCMQLGLDADDATSLLKVCQSCMDKNLEEFISNGMLDSDDEDDEGSDDDVSDEEIDDLKSGMAAAGFSEEEISNIVDLVQDAGSMEGALNILKGIAKDAGIDLPDFEETPLPEDEEEELSSYEDFINGINLEDLLCVTPNPDAIKKGIELERQSRYFFEEKKKEEASFRLKQLVDNIGLNPKVATYWNEGRLYYSYLTAGGFMGSIDKIEYDSQNVAAVKQFEEEYGSMVYHVIESNSTLIFLSVSNDPDEWQFERLESNRIMAYVYRTDDPDQSEFGDIILSALHGALVRVG